MEESSEKNLFNSLRPVDKESFVNSGVDKRKKWMACSTWLKDINLVKITIMKGNFWKICGHSNGIDNYLYPEEAVLLIEKNQLLSELDDKVIEIPLAYELLLQSVPLACYLAYIRLRYLEYICRRHSTRQLHCFNGDFDVYEILIQNPSITLLDALVSFDVYPHDSKFSKKLAKEIKPTSYVVVTNGVEVFSSRLIIKLLEEAEGVPLIFAVLLPSGSIILEELTDAAKSIYLKHSVFNLNCT